MNTINQQTPGVAIARTPHHGTPFLVSASGKLTVANGVNGSTQPEEEANARLLVAGFNLLDKTGRALNFDAAELGEGLDLVGLLNAAALVLEFYDGEHGDPGVIGAQAAEELRAALATLPRPTLAANLFAMGAETMREQAGKA